jgi:hypothetical protein
MEALRKIYDMGGLADEITQRPQATEPHTGR